MSLWGSSDDVAFDSGSGDCLQLFEVPAHRWAWVYFEFGSVKVEADQNATAEYICGDRTMRTIFCKRCGCVTHWEPLQPTPGCKQGVHLGNFDPKLIASVRVRRFDGADTWKFIDE